MLTADEAEALARAAWEHSCPKLEAAAAVLDVNTGRGKRQRSTESLNERRLSRKTRP